MGDSVLSDAGGASGDTLCSTVLFFFNVAHHLCWVCGIVSCACVLFFAVVFGPPPSRGLPLYPPDCLSPTHVMSISQFFLAQSHKMGLISSFVGFDRLGAVGQEDRDETLGRQATLRLCHIVD